MYMADGTTYQFDGAKVTTVGWLARSNPFPRGRVAVGLKNKLRDFVNAPYFGYLGLYHCDLGLCSLLSGLPRLRLGHELTAQVGDQTIVLVRRGALYRKAAAGGSFDLIVPGEGEVYYAPELIFHYVTRHGYRPPERFCEALLHSPHPYSEGYVNQLEAINPASWGAARLIALRDSFAGMNKSPTAGR